MVREFTYRGDSVGAGGGCEAAVTAIARCWWGRFMEVGMFLYGRRYLLMLNWAAYESDVRPAIVYGSEAWCLRESEMGML